jgi:hypothetical protein
MVCEDLDLPTREQVAVYTQGYKAEGQAQHSDTSTCRTVTIENAAFFTSAGLPKLGGVYAA